jgi:hypothetical protein
MLDGENDDSNLNQDLVMPDNLHSKISGDTWKMMDQKIACPTHAIVDKDFMGLEDTLNNVLRRLGDTVVFDPAQKLEAPQPHRDAPLYDPILQAQMIEMHARPVLQWSSSISQCPNRPSWNSAPRVHRRELSVC